MRINVSIKGQRKELEFKEGLMGNTDGDGLRLPTVRPANIRGARQKGTSRCGEISLPVLPVRDAEYLCLHII